MTLSLANFFNQFGEDNQKNLLIYIKHADIQDEAVIEQAKKIVDRCSPQRYGPNGTHAYSFLQREYLLNLLLFHYVDHGFFK